MILATGATGYVGRQVIAALASGGHKVRALLRSESRAPVLAGYDVELAYGDVLDPESLRRACDGVEGVVHLAGVVRESGQATFQRVNYEGTRNLLDAAATASVSRFVLASAIGTTSDPAVPYLHSRWMAEEETKRSPVPNVIVRFSVGFGEGDEFFAVLAAQVKLSPIVPIVGDGQARFQPIYVADVAKCLALACEREELIGQTIEAGGPEYFTYEQMIDLVAQTLGARIAKIHVPVAMVKPAAAIMEALMPRPMVTREQIKMLRLDNTTGIDSVWKTFGFEPQSLRDGIGYVANIGLLDALRINLGSMPAHIRDH